RRASTTNLRRANVRNLSSHPFPAARHCLPACGLRSARAAPATQGAERGVFDHGSGSDGHGLGRRLHRRLFFCAAHCAPSRPCARIALLTGLILDEYAWIGLRAFTGFVMAGAFMVIESWLNEKATNESRGTVFGLYMMVTYASIMGGQMIVAVGDVRSASLFM